MRLHLINLCIIGISLLFTGSVFGAQKIEVISLDMGECWAKPLSDPPNGSWAIASFNDATAFFVTPDSQMPVDSLKLETKLSQKLKDLGFESFPRSSYDYDLHCSGGGMSLRVKVTNDSTPLCVWARPTSSNIEIQITDVFPNPEVSEQPGCTGITTGRLVIGVADSAQRDNVIAVLTAPSPYRSNLAEVNASAVVPDGIRITLVKDTWYHEARIRSQIESDPRLRGQLKYVDYDRRASLNGESLKLFSDTYPGF